MINIFGPSSPTTTPFRRDPSPAIGLRWQELDRYVLPRRQETVLVAGQAVPLKVVRVPDGGERAKPEADAVAAAARHLGWDNARVAAAALAAWRSTTPVPPDLAAAGAAGDKQT